MSPKVTHCQNLSLNETLNDPSIFNSEAFSRLTAQQGYQMVPKKPRKAISYHLIGPTPSYVPHVRSRYRRHILLRPLLPLPQGWKVNIDPVTLL